MAYKQKRIKLNKYEVWGLPRIFTTEEHGGMHLPAAGRAGRRGFTENNHIYSSSVQLRVNLHETPW